MSDDVAQVDLAKLVSLCKRRGLVFQSSEIYGGLASTWDYGPLGVELKRNVKEAWWRDFVWGRDDMVGLDAAILMHPDAWRASGHVESFADPLVECKECHRRWREDQLDHMKFVIPDYVVLDFFDVQSGPLSCDGGASQFHLSDLRVEFLRKSANIFGPPLFVRAFLKLQGFKTVDALPAEDYVRSRSYEDLLIKAPNQIDASGSFLTSKSGGDTYEVGFPPLPHQEASAVRAICVEINTPNYGTATAEFNPTSGSLNRSRCPACGGELTDARQFNLMFKTFMGPVEDEASVTYLRPETAQGIFVNFENVVTATRRRLPFGIAQIGKAFRNEITTGGFLFRTREFEMMEIEYFVKPGDDVASHVEWIEKCKQWYIDLGVSPERLRVREHDAEELSHYSKATSDIEYHFPWGWGEIQGIANRSDYDLRAHAEKSGEALTYFDQDGDGQIVPYVIEPSAGVDRAVLTFLVDAYHEEEAPTASGKLERRVVLRLHPRVAPVKVAVLPLSRNERLVPTAREVYRQVRESGAIDGVVQYDDAQSIGRRYRRQDEVGTPLCVTVDFESLDDKAVTIRERDSMAQDRVPIEGLARALADRLDA